MSTKRKYVMPDIDELADAGPDVAELIAFVQGLTDQANAAHGQVQALEAELVRLKKAKRRTSRASK